MLTSYIVHRQYGYSAADTGWLLAIDTSTDRAGVALFNGHDLHERTWPASRAQTTQVLPNIQKALSAIDISIGDVAAISVAIGPGTFTGLRVGLSLAKGLAMAQNIPIVGVPTLSATALPWILAGVPVIALLPAGRGRLVWQVFHPDRLDHSGADAPTNGTPDELVQVAEGAEIRAIVGELPAPLCEALRASPVPVLAEPGLTSRIGAIATLGMFRYTSGDVDDLAALEPIYVHGTPRAKGPVRDAQP